MFIFEVKIYKSEKHWLAEIPALDAMTQGKTKKDAIRMAIDWLKSSLDEPKFMADILVKGDGEYVMFADQTTAMIGFFLQRQRMISGLTVREVALRLGFKSHNAYSQYERGEREPGISMLDKFLSALNPSAHLTLGMSVR